MSSLTHFRAEYEAHLTTAGGGCPFDPSAATLCTGRGGGEVTGDGMVTVTIDGTPVSVPPGTLVIRAAEMIGIEMYPGLATIRCWIRWAPAGSAWSRSKVSASRWPPAPSP